MILQVLADAFQRVANRDSCCAKHGRSADAGKLEQLRRIDRASGKDRLACPCAMQLAAHAEDDAGDASSVEIQRLGLGAGDDAQIRPPQHAAQERLRGIPAHALLLVDLEIARPFVGRRR